MRSNRRAHRVGALLLLTLLWPATSAALPVFARRYQTACSTCHVQFPKLNPLGEAGPARIASVCSQP